MSATRSSKIPNESWEKWKDVIIQLFRNEKRPLKGRHGVIETMKARHNFIASISQYEARLKKWKVRKNLTKEEWLSIGQAVMERERQGIGSEVWIFGFQVPPRKLKKEISRNCGIDQSTMDFVGETEHRLPDGVVIETPVGGGIMENVASSALPADSRTLHEVTNDVDYFSTNSMSAMDAASEGLENGGYSSLCNVDTRTTDEFYVDGSSSHSVLAGQVEGSRAVGYYSPPFSPSELVVARNPDITNTPKSTTTLDMEPCYRSLGPRDTTAMFLANELQYSNRIKNRIPTDCSAYLLASLNLHKQLLTNLLIPANKFNHATYLTLFSNTLPSRTIDILLKASLREIVLVVVVSQIINKTILPHVRRYCGSIHEKDGALQLKLEPLRAVLWYLQNSTNAVIGRFCGCLPGPYEDALREGLFEIAVQWEASNVVEGVLSTAKDGRKIIESFELRGFAPALEFAIQNLDLQSATSIVAHFGDFETGPALQLKEKLPFVSVHGPASRIWPIPVAMGFCTGFHAKGLPIPDWVVEVVFKSADFPSIQKVIRKAPNPKEITYARWMAMPAVSNAIIENLEENHQVSVFKMILPYLDRVDFDHLYNERNPRHLYSPSAGQMRWEMNRNLSRAMTHAAISHQTKLSEIFRLHGIIPSAADLCEAVRTENAVAIRALIEAGADVTGITYVPSAKLQVDELELYTNFQKTTPYAEAIRSKSTSVIEIFKSHVLHPHFAPHHYNLSIIIAASEVGDVRLLDEYLQSIPSDPEDREKDDDCVLDDALSHAIVGNQDDIIPRLLKLNFDGGRAADKPNSLKTAILSRDKARISMVLDCRIHHISPAEVVPAIRIGDTDSVRLLLNILNLLDPFVQELLFEAVEANNYEILEVLLDHGITASYQPNPRSKRQGRNGPFWRGAGANWGCIETPLTRAFRNGNNRIVDLLLRRGVPLSPSRDELYRLKHCVSALQVAAELGNADAIEMFLQYGADPWDSDALANATYRQDIACVQTLLLASNSMVEKERRRYSIPALMVAIYLANIELVQLLAQYADINQIIGIGWIDESPDFGYSNAFGVSIISGTGRSLDILRLLLDRAASLDGVSSYKHRSGRIEGHITPLLEAVSTRCIQRVELLLRHGAHINHPADRAIKRTPLQLAAELGDKAMVQYLISQGAEVNDTPAIYGGGTALQLASGGGFYGVMEILIKNDAIINAPRGRFQGRTALEAAAEHGRLDVLMLLIREGADLTSSVYGEEQYHRAMDFARRNKQEAAIKLLKSLHQVVMNAQSEVTEWPAMEPSFLGLT